MPTLLESLQPQLGSSTAGMPSPTNPSSLPSTQLGQTQGLRSLIQTSTGKAAQPGSQGPQQADIGELEAAHETNLQGQQGALADQIQTSGNQMKSDAVTQAQTAQQQTIAENVANNQSQFETRANSIISDYTNGLKKVQTQRDVMNLEQAGAALRLSNQKYVDALQRQGALSRLNSDAGFKEAAYKDEFTNGLILTTDKNAFNSMMDADDRTFKYAMSQMDIDYALQMGAQAKKQANSQAMWEGIGGISSAGAKTLAAQANWFKATPATPGSTSVNTSEGSSAGVANGTKDPDTGLTYDAVNDIWR